jgi:hypothetical protein
MATIGTKPNLMDVAKRLDPDGKIAKVAELLSQTNEVLQDMVFVEGNLPTGHKTTIRTGYPDVTWRKLNYGVQPSKSITAQVTDVTGSLEAYAVVDKSLADLNGNVADFRLSEDMAFIEAMNQEMASKLFYGNTKVDPAAIDGLAPRFAASSTDNKLIGSNVIKGTGSGSVNTSVWLVVWGENTVHGIYPKGSKAGISHNDHGEQTVLDAAGGSYQAYRTHYKWENGVVIRDWRYVVRIANIDVSTLVKDAATGTNLIDCMTQALERIPNLQMGKAVFYVNRTVSSFLRRQIVNKVGNSTLSIDDISGQKVLTFGGVPVRRTDALINTEATIS